MTIRTNFLKCFAIRAVGNALQPQVSVINVVSKLVKSGKAASSVDNEKLLKKYFHRGHPCAALIMCRSDYGRGSLVVHFIADFKRK